MLNNTVLIGKVTKELELLENENKKNEYLLTIEMEFGKREAYQIGIHLSLDMGESFKEYCQEGNIVGVKGVLRACSEGNVSTLKLYGHKVSTLTRANLKENAKVKKERVR